jgi:hypothetical protein
MKLVKSLLLGSAAGLLAVVSSQAADLPYRKAAPIEYVRICDWAGAGFFYIPGSDTCLRVGGNVDYEYEYRSRETLFAGGGNFIPRRFRDETGTWAQGRIELDARLQTGAGTMRTFIQGAFNRATGVEKDANGSNQDNGVYLGQAYVQWAGLTAGFTQSVFSYYADSYNYQTILDPDGNSIILAYTATFGGGFSATISVEDPNYHQFNSNTASGIVGTQLSMYYNGTAGVYAPTGGEEVPDVVGQLNLTQSWGSAQVSGAAHEENAIGAGRRWGFAGLAGINIKLPMLAPGDSFWLEGQGGVGALQYGLNNFTGTRYPNMAGSSGADAIGAGTQLVGAGPASTAFGDFDGVIVGGSLKLPTWFGVTGAFEHYFTPTLHADLVGSYIQVRYPGAVLLTSTIADPFTSNWDEYRVGGRLVYSPIKDLSFGVEVLYSRLHEDVPAGFLLGGAVPGTGGRVNAATGLPTLNANLDGFTGTLHVERDF